MLSLNGNYKNGDMIELYKCTEEGEEADISGYMVTDIQIWRRQAESYIGNYKRKLLKYSAVKTFQQDSEITSWRKSC